MTYIVLALKSEAQAFVDAFTLKKSKLSTFTTFSNQNFYIIISGVGVSHAREATQTLLNHFDITDDDMFINFGVCGAKPTFSIGSFLEIGTILYNDIPYPLQKEGITLTCVEESCDKNGLHVSVDMESFGFYDAVIHNPAIKHYHIYKVVSDHFQPHTLTKDGVKSLLAKHINTLFLQGSL
jgi:purine-nucleoside phosphorylase